MTRRTEIIGCALIITILFATAEEIRLNSHVLARPTIEELKEFLETDKINERVYFFPTYVCIQFARDLRLGAQNSGWNMSYVTANFVAIYSPDFIMSNNSILVLLGHAFNAIILNNGTLVYIEPQNDRIFSTAEELLHFLATVAYPKLIGKIPINSVEIDVLSIVLIW